VKIVVTLWPTEVMPKAKPAKPRRTKSGKTYLPPAKLPTRTRLRYAAEFVGGPHSGAAVVGKYRPDEAIGALLRQTANTYETADEVLDFVADLFGSHPDRSPAEQLGRAVRLAAKSPRRLNPGVEVVLPDYPAAAPALASVAAGKGGAA
jgi:hypothetical protein